MPQSGRHFLNSESGSLAPILAIMLIPMCAALGLSVDYNAAIATKGSMQNALDAATLAITTLPTSTSLADRQVKLQESFAANSGQGTAKLDGFVVAADGTASINASASFAARRTSCRSPTSTRCRSASRRRCASGRRWCRPRSRSTKCRAIGARR
ncbi:pilus assembly protein TadG-related protein [Mesorhizobium sp.]|uniref:TadE/TadG family type IV pilus assembly protein n=2 Tax=Mesorhizobium sp. TaxID=1871066 RepID=UPI00338FB50A